MGGIPDATGGAGRLRIAPLALAVLALTGVFVVLGFPYERAAARLAERIERETGARVRLGPVSGAWVRWAPGLAVRDLRIETASGKRLDVDRLGVRPALRLSWLRGRPALGVEVESAQGRGAGVAWLTAPAGFTGRVEDVDLDLLTQDNGDGLLRVLGRADADLDLVFEERGPEGEVVFEAREGVLALPGLPIPLPFATLTGDVGLGGERSAEIRELVLDSPLASGRATGTIGHAARFEAAPLEIEVALTVSGAARRALNAQGVRTDRQGAVTLRVGGTVGRPQVR